MHLNMHKGYTEHFLSLKMGRFLTFPSILQINPARSNHAYFCLFMFPKLQLKSEEHRKSVDEVVSWFIAIQNLLLYTCNELQR